MIHPLFLFVLFSLMAATGAYLIGLHFKGRRAGVVAGLLTLLFFVALLWGVYELMRRGGALTPGSSPSPPSRTTGRGE